MTPAPQFSLRLLFVVIASCAVSFGLLRCELHPYVSWLAMTILVFWGGVACAFGGLAIQTRGDTWLIAAVVMDVVGSLVCLISAFTGGFYAVLFVCLELPKTLG